MTTLQPGAFVFACGSTFLSWIQWIRWPALAFWPELLFRMSLALARRVSRRGESSGHIVPAPILLHSEAAAKERRPVWERRPASWKSAVDFAFASGARAPVRFPPQRWRFGTPALVLAAFPQDDLRVQGAKALPFSKLEPHRSPERLRRSPIATRSAQGLGPAPEPAPPRRGGSPRFDLRLRPAERRWSTLPGRRPTRG